MNTEQAVSRLFTMHQGIFHTRLLHQAIAMKIFDFTREMTTTEKLVEQLSLNTVATHNFLRGLTAIGLLIAKDSKFINSELADTFLVSESPEYLGDYLDIHAAWNFPFFDQLENILKNGATPPEKEAGDEGLWAKDARAIADFQQTCIAPILKNVIPGIDGFTNWKRMLDLGGGAGLNTAAIIREHPTMTATVFDRPSVTEVALEYIRTEQMEQRITVMAGDFSKDDFGSDWDFIMATSSLNFVRDDLESFIEKVYHSLRKGGVFLSVHDGMTNDRTNPSSIALSWLPVAMMWQNMAFDYGEISDAMQRVGFRRISSRPLSYGLGSMELDIAIK